MTQPRRAGGWAVVWALGLAGVAVVACAGKRGASKDPAECMRKCDQKNCAFVAQSVGDNAEYLECLEACEETCGGGAQE